MKSTRRIASDARYIVASIALVTSMGIFASLRSFRQHDYIPPTSLSAEVVMTTPIIADDCTCGSTSAVQTFNPSAAAAPQANAATSSDDCTCGEPSVGQAANADQTQPNTSSPDTVVVQSPSTITIQTNPGNATTDVNVNDSAIVAQTIAPSQR